MMRPSPFSAILAAPLTAFFMTAAANAEVTMNFEGMPPETRVLYESFVACANDLQAKALIHFDTENPTEEEIIAANNEVMSRIMALCADQNGLAFEPGEEPGTFTLSINQPAPVGV